MTTAAFSSQARDLHVPTGVPALEVAGGSADVFGHDIFANPRAVRRLVNRVSSACTARKR